VRYNHVQPDLQVRLRLLNRARDVLRTHSSQVPLGSLQVSFFIHVILVN
jgi:hypothetical protein